MHVGIAYMRWRGKRSRHSRRMRNRNVTYLARGPWSGDGTWVNNIGYFLGNCLVVIQLPSLLLLFLNTQLNEIVSKYTEGWQFHWKIFKTISTVIIIHHKDSCPSRLWNTSLTHHSSAILLNYVTGWYISPAVIWSDCLYNSISRWPTAYIADSYQTCRCIIESVT